MKELENFEAPKQSTRNGYILEEEDGTKKILGSSFGISIEKGYDDYLRLRILVEDDERWYEKDAVWDCVWIDDMIMVLKKTRETLSCYRKTVSGSRKIK